MMRSRRLLHPAALAALAAMLFAQAAFALAACDPAQAQSLARMIAAQQDEPATCHEPTDSANLCLAHCQGRDQTLDKHQAKLPALPADAVLVLRLRQDFHQPPAWVAREPAPVVGPPPHILFRSLLI
jgi:hypothetical protein